MVIKAESCAGSVSDDHNATIQLMLGRRSARDQFTDRPVPNDVIAEILRCGLAAPSSKNARPWKPHVVTDRAVIAELADAVANADGADTYLPIDPVTGLPRSDWPSSVRESADVLRAVPLAIFIENLGTFSRGRATLAGVPTDQLQASLVTYTLEVIGIGACVMNMWLAAASQGAQAAFMGDVCVAETTIARRLGIQCDLVGVLAIGYGTSHLPAHNADYDPSDDPLVSWRRSPIPA